MILRANWPLDLSSQVTVAPSEVKDGLSGCRSLESACCALKVNWEELTRERKERGEGRGRGGGGGGGGEGRGGEGDRLTLHTSINVDYG